MKVNSQVLMVFSKLKDMLTGERGLTGVLQVYSSAVALVRVYAYRLMSPLSQLQTCMAVSPSVLPMMRVCVAAHQKSLYIIVIIKCIAFQVHRHSY